MKKFLIIFLLAVLIAAAIAVFAGEFETPHTFYPGDTISTDMMNEIFDYLKNKNKKMIPSDIIATWICNVTTSKPGDSMPVPSKIHSAWSQNTESLNYSAQGTIKFVGDGDGTYSYSTTSWDLMRSNDVIAGLGDWELREYTLWFNISTKGTATTT